MLGCKAAAGIPVSDISKETQVSRTYIYQQKANVKNYMETLDKAENPVLSINIDKSFIERMVLSLSLECQSSTEGIRRHLASIFGLHISYGKISSILAEASKRAEKFDASIPLDSIKQGANDEIFQGNIPVLTGIDVESTYIYLLSQACNRSAVTWQHSMEEQKEHGLGLEVSISDAGTGLNSGIPKAFPNISVQPDIFHELRPVGAELARLERKAEKLIADEAGLEERARAGRPRKKTMEQLGQIREKVELAVQEYDLLRILFCWLVELTGFSGYSFGDACLLAEWVLSEMDTSFPNRLKLLAQTKKLREKLPQLLSFLQRMDAGFAAAALERGIPPEAFSMMYQQRACHTSSSEYVRMEYRLGELLGSNYGMARQEFNYILEHTKRASSLVENLNSRIRVYMNLKRMVPEKYFILLKVYFNTKKYHRSRIPERIGKSPLELMTGKEYPEFLEVLGY